MFGLFKKKLSVSESANASEILPVAEDGDFKAFIIRVNQSTKDFSSSLSNEGGQGAISKFVGIIDGRIERNDFENIFDVVDQMLAEYGGEPKRRNKNVERLVVCNDAQGYAFKWNPDY